MLSLAVDDPTLRQIIGRKLDAYLIPRNDPNEVLSHPTGYVSHHLASGFQLYPKARIGQSLCHCAFNFEGIFFLSQNQSSTYGMLASTKPFSRHRLDLLSLTLNESERQRISESWPEWQPYPFLKR